MREFTQWDLLIAGERMASLQARVDQLEAENARLRAAQAIVREQAEDGGCWFVAETAAEAYLQQELRRLHAALEVGQ